MFFMSWKEELSPVLTEVTKGSVRLNSRSARDYCMSVILNERSQLSLISQSREEGLTGVEHEKFSKQGLTNKRTAKVLLKAVREHLPDGLIAFIGTETWPYWDRGELSPDRRNGIEIVIGPGENQFDILKIQNTQATNYGMETGDLIARLKDIHSEYGIDIWHAEYERIEFDLFGTPTSKLVDDLLELCPCLFEGATPSQANDLTGFLNRLIERKSMSLVWR